MIKRFGKESTLRISLRSERKRRAENRRGISEARQKQIENQEKESEEGRGVKHQKLSKKAIKH